MATVLETKAVTKQYQSDGGAIYNALNGVDITVEAGEFVAIMGPSGSGKSTLLYLMGGLDKPSGGDVLLNGKSLVRQSVAELAVMRRRYVGFVFQFFNLLPTFTVEENITLPLRLDGQNLATNEAQARLKALIDLVGLENHRSQRPDQLSGGQQQRVAIARALIHKPALLLADEPTGNLDSRTADGILKLFRKLVDEQQQTIVMVTHDPRAAAIADRVVMLKDGVIADKTTLGSKRGTQEIVVQLAALTAGQ